MGDDNTKITVKNLLSNFEVFLACCIILTYSILTNLKIIKLKGLAIIIADIFKISLPIGIFLNLFFLMVLIMTVYNIMTISISLKMEQIKNSNLKSKDSKI